MRDQPEASTSTASPPSRHLVSLVIDSSLPKDQYLKLVEANGVVHSLIQRLMEKHGGESDVSTVAIGTAIHSMEKTS